MTEIDLDELVEMSRRLDLGECEVAPPPPLPGMRAEEDERVQFVYVVREPQFVLWPWVLFAAASFIGGLCLGALGTLVWLGLEGAVQAFY